MADERRRGTAGGSLGNPGSGWSVIGTGDFNGDGKADILLQNSDGTLYEWQMNGVGIAAGASAGNPGASWKAVGIGDFNGDGKSDILLRNSDGTLYEWQMNGAVVAAGASLGNPGGAWSAVGVGDYTGDGDADILLRNSDGTLYEWQMNGSVLVGGAAIANPGASWAVVGSRTVAAPAAVTARSDFNGDARSDILLRNANDGTLYAWQMDGAAVRAGGSLGNPGAGWSAAGFGDFNGDGKSDIVLRNSDGTLYEWHERHCDCRWRQDRQPRGQLERGGHGRFQRRRQG